MVRTATHASSSAKTDGRVRQQKRALARRCQYRGRDHAVVGFERRHRHVGSGGGARCQNEVNTSGRNGRDVAPGLYAWVRNAPGVDETQVAHRGRELEGADAIQIPSLLVVVRQTHVEIASDYDPSSKCDQRSNVSRKCWCAKTKKCGPFVPFSRRVDTGDEHRRQRRRGELGQLTSRSASSRKIAVSTDSGMRQTITTPHAKFTERRLGGNTDEV